MTAKTKKIIAREFIYLIIGVALSFSSYLISNFWGDIKFERNNQSKNSITNEIEKIKTKLTSKQYLWLTIKKHKLSNLSYSEFLNEYKNEENQKTLYTLCLNNELYTESFDDFQLKYFTKNRVMRDIILIYQEENGILIKEDEIKVLLQKPHFFDWLYKKFVEGGYKHSKTDLFNLIFKNEGESITPQNLYETYQKQVKLEEELEKIENSRYQEPFEFYAIIIFSILFLLRYLIYSFVWSIKQLKS